MGEATKAHDHIASASFRVGSAVDSARGKFKFYFLERGWSFKYFFKFITFLFIFAYGHVYMRECVSITLAVWKSQDKREVGSSTVWAPP